MEQTEPEKSATEVADDQREHLPSVETYLQADGNPEESLRRRTDLAEKLADFNSKLELSRM